MRLLRVIYELFESDARALDHRGADDWHEIDREIRLDGDGTAPIYVTWHDRPVAYSIRVFDRPVFSQPAPVLRDMSQSPLWRDLVGKDVTIQFMDAGHQVLAIRAGTHAVYCSSQEQGKWLADTVHISAVQPMAPELDQIERGL